MVHGKRCRYTWNLFRSNGKNRAGRGGGKGVTISLGCRSRMSRQQTSHPSHAGSRTLSKYSGLAPQFLQLPVHSCRNGRCSKYERHHEFAVGERLTKETKPPRLARSTERVARPKVGLRQSREPASPTCFRGGRAVVDRGRCCHGFCRRHQAARWQCSSVFGAEHNDVVSI